MDKSTNSMSAQLTSSEAIAIALKGSGLSSEEKIRIATEAWKSSSVFFPHKDEFLLEWVCGSLLKAGKGIEKYAIFVRFSML